MFNKKIKIIMLLVVGAFLGSCNNELDDMESGRFEVFNNSEGVVLVQLNQGGRTQFQESLNAGDRRTYDLNVGNVRVYAEDTLKDNYIDFVQIVSGGFHSFNIITSRSLVIRNNQDQETFFYYQRSLPGQDMPDGEWIPYKENNNIVAISAGAEIPLNLTFGYRYWASTTDSQELEPGKNLFRFQVRDEPEVIDL